MPRISRHAVFFAWLLALLVNSSGTVHADKKSSELLLKKFTSLNEENGTTLDNIRLSIVSSDQNGLKQGEVFGVLAYDFQSVYQVLSKAENWCDIVPQHLNIKVCTYKKINGETRLSFYTGRKFYEPPENTFRLDYLYRLMSNEQDYFRVKLSAEQGPLGTSDYLIEVEATGLSANETLLHFSYAYQQGLVADLAMAGYFATLGSDKIGFSRTGQDENGKPVYVGGVRGALERNAVRYYLALQSYIETRDININDRFIKSAGRWYGLTKLYHAQLYEMPEKEYLEYKKKERADQLKLQQEVDKEPEVGVEKATISDY